MEAATLIRDARHRAGLTQTALAERMGVPQPVVARLEREGSNPTFRTLTAALEAAGWTIVTTRRTSGNVDESLIRSNLRLTPEQRLQQFDHFYADARELALAGRRARGVA